MTLFPPQIPREFNLGLNPGVVVRIHSNASIKADYTVCWYGRKQGLEQTSRIKFHRNPTGLRDWKKCTSIQAWVSHYEIARCCSPSAPSQSSHVKGIGFCTVMLFWTQVWMWYGDNNSICSLAFCVFFLPSPYLLFVNSLPFLLVLLVYLTAVQLQKSTLPFKICFNPLHTEFLRSYIHTFRPPLWSSCQSSWLQIQRFGFDSRCYQIFWEAVGLEWSPLSLVSTTEELFGRKSSGPGLESKEYGRRDPSCWPRGTLYPQKLALTSPTNAVARSV
jgi:hypothetical protein